MIAEQVRELSQQKREAADSAYDQLVRDTAFEIEVVPESALAILELVGKDSEDLERDAEQISQRRQWSEQVAAGADAQANSETLTAEIDAGDCELVRLQREWSVRRTALVADRERQHAIVWEATAAKNKLIRSAPRELTRAEQVLVDDRSQLVQRAAAIRQTLRSAGVAEQRELVRAQNEAERRYKSDTAQAGVEAARQAIANVQGRIVAPNTKALSDIETRLAEIEREIAAIHARKLQP